MVAGIKAELGRRQEQALKEGQIDTSSLEALAKAITADGNARVAHGFMTTNWNTIIDLVLRPHGLRVWHLNGSIDGPGDAFLTEADTPEQRKGSLEKHPGFRWLLEAEVCVGCRHVPALRIRPRAVTSAGNPSAWAEQPVVVRRQSKRGRSQPHVRLAQPVRRPRKHPARAFVIPGLGPRGTPGIEPQRRVTRGIAGYCGGSRTDGKLVFVPALSVG
jgi:hypothetical protein